MRPLVLLTLLVAPSLAAQERTLDALLADAAGEGVIRSAIGVTRAGTAIPSLIQQQDLDFDTPKARVLLIGGLDGSDAGVRAVLAEWKRYRGRADLLVSAVPVARPDAWMAGRTVALGEFPPEGQAYQSEQDPEAQYLWRWIGMHAPDLVVVALASEDRGQASALVRALGEQAPSDTATIPAVEAYSATADSPFLDKILSSPPARLGPSPARLEIRKRLDRSPLQLAGQLAKVYGHELDSVVYIPTVALISRLRLGRLSGDESHLADVERIVSPYLSGAKPTLPEKPTSSHLPGHLIFAELARASGNARYVELARAAADLGFSPQGEMLESMPSHNEMSDSLFMGCAISASVGALTGERKYFDMAVRHMRFMQRLDWRDDGLYRHSPLDEAAWGRGNGFPALGLSMSLTFLPPEHPGRAEMLAAYQRHMNALLQHQDPTGAWHQVIDRPESYRELTATSMIGFALVRGLRLGWISGERYRQAAERAWYAVKTRVRPDGGLVDVCTGTGKQPDLRAYYDRAAILGRDDRGGAMAMLFATEFAQLKP